MTTLALVYELRCLEDMHRWVGWCCWVWGGCGLWRLGCGRWKSIAVVGGDRDSGGTMDSTLRGHSVGDIHCLGMDPLHLGMQPCGAMGGVVWGGWLQCIGQCAFEPQHVWGVGGCASEDPHMSCGIWSLENDCMLLGGVWKGLACDGQCSLAVVCLGVGGAMLGGRKLTTLHPHIGKVGGGEEVIVGQGQHECSRRGRGRVWRVWRGWWWRRWWG